MNILIHQEMSGLEKSSMLSLPQEIHVKIATYLDTTRNLANFKMSCSRIYNAIESEEKVDRKRLPHLKVRRIRFTIEPRYSQIIVSYRQSHDNGYMSRNWRDWGSLSTKLHVLIQHWIFGDHCQIEFWDHSILNCRLLKSLLKINYGNAIQCEIVRAPSDPAKFQEALPFIHEFLKKISCCFLKCFSSTSQKLYCNRKGFLYIWKKFQ